MINWLKKISNKYYTFLEKKSVKIIIEYMLIVWTLVTFLLYSYYYNYFNITITFLIVMSLALIFLIFIHGPKSKINGENLHKVIKMISKRDKLHLSIKSLILIFLILAIGISNFLFIVYSDIDFFAYFLYSFCFLFFLTFLIVVYIKNKNISFSELIIRLKKYFSVNRNFKITALLASPFFAINIFLYFILGDKYINTIINSNPLFYELNIIQKLASLILFYTLLIILVYAIGRKIFKLFNFNFSSRLEQFIFSIGLGLVPIMFSTFIVSVLGVLSFWTIWIIILLFTVLSFSELRQITKEVDTYKLKLSFSNRLSSFKNIALIGLFVLLTFNFVAITKPIPTTTDDLHTYFNVPKLLVDYGEYRVHNSGVSNMGQNTEMIYTAIMSITDSRFIVHFQLIFFALCLMGFYLLLRKTFNETLATLGLLAIYFVPWNTYYASTVKVEFLLSFYLLLVIYSFFLWRREDKNLFLYLLGVFSGISLGIKYNAALLLIPVYLLIIITLIKKNKTSSSAIKIFITTLFLAVLFFSPWAIKNQFYFNNAFYPFNYITNNSEKQDFIVSDKFYEKNADREIDHLRHSVQYKKSSPASIIKTAWQHSIGRSARGGWVNFGFIPLLIVPFYFLRKNKKESNVLLSIVLLYLLLWYIVEGARPWYAFFGFLLLYSLLPNLFKNYKKFTIIYLVISFMVFLSGFNIMVSNVYYLPGKINKKEYIARAIPYYETAKYINNLNLGSNEKILLVEDMVIVFINRNDELIFVDPYLVKSNYALSKGEKFYYESLKQSSIKYIIQSKRKEKAFFTWLSNNDVPLKKYLDNYHEKSPSIYSSIGTLNSFLEKYTTKVFNDGHYTLYKLN